MALQLHYATGYHRKEQNSKWAPARGKVNFLEKKLSFRQQQIIWFLSAALCLFLARPDFSWGWFFALFYLLFLFRGLEKVTGHRQIWTVALAVQIIWAWIWFSWVKEGTENLWKFDSREALAAYLGITPFFLVNVGLFILFRQYIVQKVRNFLGAACLSGATFVVLDFMFSFQNATPAVFLWRQPSLLTFSKIGGSYFITFLLVFLSELGHRWSQNKKSYLRFFAPILGFAIASCFTDWMSSVRHSQDGLSVVAVQTTSDGKVGRDVISTEPGAELPVLNSLNRHLRSILIQHSSVKMIIFPEMILPRYYSTSNRPEVLKLKAEFERTIVQNDLTVFIGRAGSTADGDLSNEFGVLWVANGELQSEFFAKRRPFPFGEMLPDILNFPWIAQFFPAMSLKEKGHRNIAGVTKDIPWGGLICNEVFFPEYASAYRKLGARLLIVMGGEGMIARTSASSKLAGYAVLRAIENGMPLIKSADDAGSMIVDARGKILNSAPLYQEKLLFEKLDLANPEMPLASAWPDWFLKLSVIISVLGTMAVSYLNLRKR